MNFFLDTNICIYFLNGKYSNILQNFKKHDPKNIKIPAIVKAELLYGAEKSKNCVENKKKIDNFLFPFEIVDFDSKCAEKYAVIRSDLEKKGEIIGPNYLLIASTVLGFDGVLVTNNTKEFARVENLILQNWV